MEIQATEGTEGGVPSPVEAEVAHLSEHVGEVVTLRGWVETLRVHGRVAFILLRDGTGELQGVLVQKALGEEGWEKGLSVTQECSIALTGEVKAEPRAPGGHELLVSGIEILGASPEYPIQPKEHGVDFLLDHRHLWLRSSRQRAGLKVRSEIEYAIHDFFHSSDFVRIDSPILTGAIGEHAGSLFKVDYFGEPAFLSQTGQLYIEAAAAAFRKVYCFGPTFRAEKSKTRRHLTEFWMAEAEVAFADSDANMDLQEALVRHLIGWVLDRCREELKVLERDPAPLEALSAPFPRISYTDAVARLQGLGSEIEWGADFGAPDEIALADSFGGPVFVKNYPKAVKAFYMKENPEDPRTVLCNDLLAPEGYGEIIGGSQREDDLDRIVARIEEEKLPAEAYGWYLDLRRYGTFPHSGFGLGTERMTAWMTGRPHVRELIPFPRMLNRLMP